MTVKIRVCETIEIKIDQDELKVILIRELKSQGYTVTKDDIDFDFHNNGQILTTIHLETTSEK